MAGAIYKVGVDFTRLDTTPIHLPGQEEVDLLGTTYKYGKCALTAGLTANFVYHVSQSFGACSFDAIATSAVASSFAPNYFCVPQVNMTANQWGWAAVKGPMTVQVNPAPAIAGTMAVLSADTRGVLSTPVGNNTTIKVDGANFININSPTAQVMAYLPLGYSGV